MFSHDCLINRRNLILLVCLLVISCSTLHPREVKEEQQSVFSDPQTKWLRLPEYTIPKEFSKKDNCGVQAMTAILRYYGNSTDIKNIYNEIYDKNIGGTLSLHMLTFPRKLGYSTRIYQGSLETLRDQIDLGVPMIIMVYHSSWLKDNLKNVTQEKQVNHYLVVYGYNETDNYFIVKDGKRDVRIANEELYKVWSAANLTTIQVSKLE